MHLAGGVHGRAKHWTGPRISLQLVECGEGVETEPCHYPHQYVPNSIFCGFANVSIPADWIRGASQIHYLVHDLTFPLSIQN